MSKQTAGDLDIEKICRTCLNVGEMTSLNENILNIKEQLYISDFLENCTQLKYSKKDGFPAQICLQCLEQVNNLYIFIEKCKNSEKILQKQYRRTNKTKKSKKSAKTRKKCATEVEIKVESEDDLPLIKLKEFNSENDVKCELSGDENSVKLELSCDENDYDSLPEKRVTRSGPYECRKCAIEFNSWRELRLHRQSPEHPRAKYARRACSVCGIGVAYCRMAEHMRTHTREKPYVCGECGARFSVSSNLRRHTLARHADHRPHICDLCGRGFSRLGLLRGHALTHTGERPHVCSVCGKAFTQPGGLRAHQLTHEPKNERENREPLEKKHICSECGRGFVTKSQLGAHERRAHGEKRWLCSECGRGFRCAALLRSHARTHTGERPHECSTCGARFSHATSLRSHALTHTGERPHACPTCGKRFAQSNHVRYHMRTHTGERPYACAVCGKTFAINGNLTVHMRTHTGETPYPCPATNCTRAFHDSSSMKKHLKGHHTQI